MYGNIQFIEVPSLSSNTTSQLLEGFFADASNQPATQEILQKEEFDVDKVNITYWLVAALADVVLVSDGIQSGNLPGPMGYFVFFYYLLYYKLG